MGTTLTGTTPQDTYDSLIKVTDNGPLSGSLKALSDGLGNDSTLSLSTTAASIAGTLAVSGDVSIADKIVHIGDTNTAIRFPAADTITFETSGLEAARITSAGNVGIGTSAPSTRLTIDNAANSTTRAIDLVGNGSTVKGRLGVFSDGVYLSGNYYFDGSQNNDTSGLGQTLIVMQSVAGSASNILFRTSAAGSTTTTQRVSIDADGLKFGSDTAAANALDDYEEGTWTMGISFGGASVGVTTSANTGGYTKIGRQVTATGYLQLSSKGSSTGVARITGLPFTINNSDAATTTASIRFNLVTFANQFQGWGQVNSTFINLEEITEAGVVTSLTEADFANNSQVMVSITYFV